MPDFNETYKDWVEQNIQFVQEQFAEKKCISPFIVLLIKRETAYESMYIAIPNNFFENDKTKNALSKLIIKTIKENQPSGFLMVLEGWMYKFQKGQDKSLEKAILSGQKQISDMKDKEEAVIMNFETPITATTYVFEILRYGDKVSLKEPKKIDDFGGRFAKYLHTIRPN